MTPSRTDIREEVYDMLDGERAFQDAKHPGTNAVGRWLGHMERHLAMARDAWAHGDLLALEGIRKVTALGVACMEQHSTPPRVGVHGTMTVRDPGDALRRSLPPMQEQPVRDPVPTPSSS